MNLKAFCLMALMVLVVSTTSMTKFKGSQINLTDDFGRIKDLAGIRFKLQRDQGGWIINATALKSLKVFKSRVLFEGMSDDYAISNFQTLKLVELKRNVIYVNLSSYKEPIILFGPPMPAVQLGFPVTWDGTHDCNHVNYMLDNTGDGFGKYQAWRAKKIDGNAWIQISSMEPKYWTAVTLQGRGDYDEWVTRYVLQYSLGEEWHDVDGGERIEGNSDRTTKVTYTFQTPVFARTLRIIPKAWNNTVSLRFEAYFNDA